MTSFKLVVSSGSFVSTVGSSSYLYLPTMSGVVAFLFLGSYGPFLTESDTSLLSKSPCGKASVSSIGYFG